MHLYIHIPYCVSKCDYCDFFSVPLLKDFSQEKLNEVSVPEEYIDSLVTEIKFRLNEYRIKSLKTVYRRRYTKSFKTGTDRTSHVSCKGNSLF